MIHTPNISCSLPLLSDIYHSHTYALHSTYSSSVSQTHRANFYLEPYHWLYPLPETVSPHLQHSLLPPIPRSLNINASGTHSLNTNLKLELSPTLFYIPLHLLYFYISHSIYYVFYLRILLIV